MAWSIEEGRRVSNIENFLYFSILSWASYDVMLKLLKSIPQEPIWWSVTVALFTLLIAFMSGLFFTLAAFFFIRISGEATRIWISYIKNKLIPDFIKPVFKFIKDYKLYFSRLISFIIILILGIIFYNYSLDYWAKLISVIGALVSLDWQLKKYK